MAVSTLAVLYHNAPASLKRKMHEESYKRGQLILSMGDQPQQVYIVLAGQAEVTTYTSEGRAFSLSYFGPWELFGEIEALQPQLPSLQVAALTDCRTIAIPHAVLFEWMRADFEFNLFLCRLLVQRLDTSYKRETRLFLMPQRIRVLWRLDSLAKSGELDAVTKADLCSELVIPLRSLNRIVAGLCAEGLIRFSKKRFAVPDPARLRREYEPYL